MNQSLNQWIDQSIKQSSDWAIDQWIGRSMNQLTCLFLCHSTSYSFDGSFSSDKLNWSFISLSFLPSPATSSIHCVLQVESTHQPSSHLHHHVESSVQCPSAAFATNNRIAFSIQSNRLLWWFIWQRANQCTECIDLCWQQLLWPIDVFYRPWKIPTHQRSIWFISSSHTTILAERSIDVIWSWVMFWVLQLNKFTFIISSNGTIWCDRHCANSYIKSSFTCFDAL